MKDPIFATIALAFVSSLEGLNFVFYLLASINFLKGKESLSQKWFFRAIFTSITLFSLFSIADQVFGDRFQLLEHGLFWLILIASWVLFKYISSSDGKLLEFKVDNGLKIAIAIGILITAGASISIIDFSSKTFNNVSAPVEGIEVIEDVYKFDFPFLADKLVYGKPPSILLKKTIQNLKLTISILDHQSLTPRRKHICYCMFLQKK